MDRFRSCFPKSNLGRTEVRPLILGADRVEERRDQSEARVAADHHRRALPSLRKEDDLGRKPFVTPSVPEAARAALAFDEGAEPRGRARFVPLGHEPRAPLRQQLGFSAARSLGYVERPEQEVRRGRPQASNLRAVSVRFRIRLASRVMCGRRIPRPRRDPIVSAIRSVSMSTPPPE